MDSSDKSEFKYNVALFITILFIILILTLFTIICTKIHLGYTSSRVNTNSTPNPNTIIVDIGIDEVRLNSFPKLVYSQAIRHLFKAGNSKGGEDGSCCSICLAEYKESDLLRLLPDCGHLFHVKCVDLWLRLHPTCPMCRTSSLPRSV